MADEIKEASNIKEGSTIFKFRDDTAREHIDNASVHVTASEKAAWNSKQAALTANGVAVSSTVDTEPTAGHTNALVTSDGVANALEGIGGNIGSKRDKWDLAVYDFDFTPWVALHPELEDKVMVEPYNGTGVQYAYRLEDDEWKMLGYGLRENNGVFSLNTVPMTSGFTDLIGVKVYRTAPSNTDALAKRSDLPELAAPSEDATDLQAAKAKATYDFVNSSINAMAAFYITKNAAGDSFATKAELNAAIESGTFYNGGHIREPTKNDYLYVLADESVTPIIPDVAPTTRYSFDGEQWAFQIIVNNTALTAAQVNAINSGVTAALVAWLTTFKGSDTSTTLSSVLSSISGKADKATGLTAATKCKITYNAQGIVTGGAALAAEDIPSLDASKIASGTLPDARIASAATWNAKQNALTANQLSAVNSGITSTLVALIPSSAKQTTWDNKLDKTAVVALDSTSVATGKAADALSTKNAIAAIKNSTGSALSGLNYIAATKTLEILSDTFLKPED